MMKVNLPLAQDKKLMVEFRIEPGCLGPQGDDHVEEFCQFAQKEFAAMDADFIHWRLVPRHDKSQAEKQYKINHKIMTDDKAEKYLALFEKNLDEFEDRMDEKLISLVEQYLGR